MVIPVAIQMGIGQPKIAIQENFFLSMEIGFFVNWDAPKLMKNPKFCNTTIILS